MEAFFNCGGARGGRILPGKLTAEGSYLHMLREKGSVIKVMRKKERTVAVVRKMFKEKSSRGVLPISLHLDQWNALKVKRRKKKKGIQSFTIRNKVICNKDCFAIWTLVLTEFGIYHYHPYTCG